MCHNTFVLYLVSTRVGLDVLYSGSVFRKDIFKGKGGRALFSVFGALFSWLQLRLLFIFTHYYFDCLGVPQVEWKMN